jgi:hypothetical protein
VNIVNSFRQAFRLLHSSFRALSPFILVGLVSSIISNNLLQNMLNHDTSWGATQAFWLFLTLILSCAIHFSILLGAYSHHNKQPLRYLEIIKQSFLKLPSVFLLFWRYLLPAMVVLALFFGLSALPSIVFGTADTDVGNSSLDNSFGSVNADVSVPQLGNILSLFISASYVITLAYTIYIFLLYFILAQMNIVSKNLTVRKSMKQSKKLVQNRKLYVFFTFVFMAILSLVLTHSIKGLLGDRFLPIAWLFNIPFQACLTVVVYNYLEKLNPIDK